MIPLLRPTFAKRLFFFILVDIVLSFISLYGAYLLRFNFDIPAPFLEHFWNVYFVLTGFKILGLFLFKNYFIIWRFFSFVDAKNIVYAHIVSYGLFTVVYLFFTEYFVPFARSILVIDFFLSLVLIGAIRAAKRFLLERNHTQLHPTLLIGINNNTTTIIQSALKGDIAYYPVAILSLDDEDNSRYSYIHNIKVYSEENLESVSESKNIKSVILVEPMTPAKLKLIVERLSKIGISDIKQVKLLDNNYDKLEDLSIEDLLARHPKDLDRVSIQKFIKNRSVLITGAGGSIGSEIAKQCERYGASKLTLIDNSEFNLYQIGEQIKNRNLKLLDVTDKKMLDKAFAENRPDIVIHAAAYKHVPICEENTEMAVYNNVLGSKNVMDASIQYGVEKVVLISTDKAVRPSNIMGATKRVAELYAQNVDAKKTEIVAVRFGNVLGSSGSVIPKFKSQIEAGGPVTVTDPEITRYFMLISEACELVLQAATIAKGGELFILDMGEPIKIDDLAKQMIRLYGKEEEIEVVYTGLRPGEKLYEELLLDSREKNTQYSSIFIAKPTVYDLSKLNIDIDNLLVAEDKFKALQIIVPEFTRKH